MAPLVKITLADNQHNTTNIVDITTLCHLTISISYSRLYLMNIEQLWHMTNCGNNRHCALKNYVVMLQYRCNSSNKSIALHKYLKQYLWM